VLAKRNTPCLDVAEDRVVIGRELYEGGLDLAQAHVDAHCPE